MRQTYYITYSRICVRRDPTCPVNWFEIKTGDLFHQDTRADYRGECDIERYRFDQLTNVKKLTMKEAFLALRELKIDDLDSEHYEGPDKECPDDAELNLSDSDDDPSAE